MKKIKIFVLAGLVLTAFAFTVFQSVNWKVNESGYSVKSGPYSFRGLKATISFDEAHPERSGITATIDARTIKTPNDLMTEHAKEALGTDKFPSINFESTAIAKTSQGYEATGNLTLKGVTKKVKLPFTFDSKNDSKQFPFFARETFRGTLTISPKDFNVTRDGTPDQMTIELTIPVTKG